MSTPRTTVTSLMPLRMISVDVTMSWSPCASERVPHAREPVFGRLVGLPRDALARAVHLDARALHARAVQVVLLAVGRHRAALDDEEPLLFELVDVAVRRRKGQPRLVRDVLDGPGLLDADGEHAARVRVREGFRHFLRTQREGFRRVADSHS